ncbi:MAG: adenosine deaminase family protein, partial [Acetivibrio sp.]
KAEQEFGILGKIIVCGMRHEQPEKNAAMLEEIKEYIGNQVCAGDLAGSESDFPPLLQTPFFEKAKELGLPFTIHAGECGSAENVQDAISLGAKRVGHGIALMKNDTIRGFTKEKGIALEMCPSSNFQTKAVSNRKEYPIRKFLEEGILVTINTDNRTVTGTTMTKEFKVLMEEFQLTKEEILKITENAINAAFIQEGTRESLRKKLESVKL